MSTPARIDVEGLLQPIPLEQPADPHLERKTVDFVFRQALRSGDAAQQGYVRGDGGAAELDRLIELGTAYLTGKSKDLVVASWIVEVLSLKFGFAGLRDGLRLIRGLISHFWEECHPPLGPDGDMDNRSMSIHSMASERYLLLTLRRLPLVDLSTGAAPFCFLDAHKRRPLRGSALTEEDISTGPIGEGVNRSSRRFYEQLADDLREAAEAAQALGQEVKERFHADAPMRPLGASLAEFQQLLSVILAVKRRQEPDAESSKSPSEAEGPMEPASARAAPVAPGPAGAALDYGRVVIEFADRAKELAEHAARLRKNREDYQAHQDAMKQLDDEYKEIVQRIRSDKDFEVLLATKLEVERGAESSA